MAFLLIVEPCSKALCYCPKNQIKGNQPPNYAHKPANKDAIGRMARE